MLLLRSLFAFDNTFEFVIIIFLAGFHAEVGNTENQRMNLAFEKLSLEREC